MNKTKHQLRAEAVGRLREIENRVTLNNSAIVDALVGNPGLSTFGRIEAVIDLLTDEDTDAPEADANAPIADNVRKRPQSVAVEWLRLAADSIQDEEDPEYTLVERRIFGELADMVERGYVRREDYEDAAELCHRYAEDAADLRAERDKWEREAKTQRNNFEGVRKNSEFYKSQILGLAEAFGYGGASVKAALEHIREAWAALNAERDEWKAKAQSKDEPVSSEGSSEVLAGSSDENSRQYAELGKRRNVADRESCADLGTAEAGASQVPKSDTREKLEADTWSFLCDNAASSCDYGLAYGEIIALLDRQAAIDERVWREYCDRKLGLQGLAENESLREQLEQARSEARHWQLVADRHDKERHELNRKLKDGRAHWMPEGIEWPCFEDGSLVKVGDTVRREVGSIEFFSDRFELRAKDHSCISRELYGKTFECPPLLASDDQPIEVGQVLYGQDGKGWRVTGFLSSKDHSVVGENADGGPRYIRELKPEWLTHEQPDSFERIIADACRATDFAGGIGAGKLGELVRRCEKLAGGAA